MVFLNPCAMPLSQLYLLLQPQALQPSIMMPWEVLLLFSFFCLCLWGAALGLQRAELRFSAIKFWQRRPNNKFYNSDVLMGFLFPSITISDLWRAILCRFWLSLPFIFFVMQPWH